MQSNDRRRGLAAGLPAFQLALYYVPRLLALALVIFCLFALACFVAKGAQWLMNWG